MYLSWLIKTIINNESGCSIDILRKFKILTKGENPISVLMVTHDPNLASQADRMLLMKDGVVAASDIKSAWGIKDEEEEE